MGEINYFLCRSSGWSLRRNMNRVVFNFGLKLISGCIFKENQVNGWLLLGNFKKYINVISLRRWGSFPSLYFLQQKSNMRNPSGYICCLTVRSVICFAAVWPSISVRIFYGYRLVVVVWCLSHLTRNHKNISTKHVL